MWTRFTGVATPEVNAQAINDYVADQGYELVRAHEAVGGDMVSAGGTGTYDLHESTGVTEIQAGTSPRAVRQKLISLVPPSEVAREAA